MREVEHGDLNATGPQVENFDKYYTAELRCLNCWNIWNACIDFGTLVADYIKNNGPQSLCDCCKCPDARIVLSAKVR